MAFMPKSITRLTTKGFVIWGVFLLALVVVMDRVAFAAEQADSEVFGLHILDDVSEPILQLPEKEILHLSLAQCIKLALENNLDIQIAGYEPAIQMADVVSAEAAFDAVVFASAERQNTDQNNQYSEFFERTVISGTGTRRIKYPTEPFRRSHDDNYSLGLRQRLATGATIELAQLYRRYRNFTDADELYYNTFCEYDLQILLRQPLLRDFGITVNRAAIYGSRNNFEISKLQFELQVIKMAAQIEQDYWGLLAARQRVIIFQALLNQAEVTLSKLNLRRSRDADTAVVMQSKALIERANASIITSRNSIRQQQDILLKSINDPCMPLENTWEIIPTEQFSGNEFIVDLPQSRELALSIRLEPLVQQYRLKNASLSLAIAKNQALPRLDIILQQDNTGAGRSDSGAWENQWQNETISHTVGLSFEIPIGNRAGQAGIAKAKHIKHQEQCRMANIKDTITAEVNIAAHRIDDTYKEIDARRLAVVAESNTLESYLAMDKAEQGTTPGVLDRKIRAQERLANAQLNFADTLLRYNLSVMNFQRSQGTLLQYNNIQLAQFDK